MPREHATRQESENKDMKEKYEEKGETRGEEGKDEGREGREEGGIIEVQSCNLVEVIKVGQGAIVKWRETADSRDVTRSSINIYPITIKIDDV